jgi:uncharacterized membrane protein HdeD (DUF308 family)
MTNQPFKRIRQSIKHWYIPLIIGILLIATAFWTFTSPIESYVALSLLFSISFLVSGVLEVFFALSNRDEIDNWGWVFVLGLATAIIGGLMMTHPMVSMEVLPVYVGFMVLFRSIMAIGWALDLKNYGVLDWGNLMLVGVLGTLFGFILLWNPIFAGLTIVIWTGIGLLVSGVFSIYISFKMKKLHNKIKAA